MWAEGTLDKRVRGEMPRAEHAQTTFEEGVVS